MTMLQIPPFGNKKFDHLYPLFLCRPRKRRRNAVQSYFFFLLLSCGLQRSLHTILWRNSPSAVSIISWCCSKCFDNIVLRWKRRILVFPLCVFSFLCFFNKRRCFSHSPYTEMVILLNFDIKYTSPQHQITKQLCVRLQ